MNCKEVIGSVECVVPVSGASKSRSARKGIASGSLWVLGEAGGTKTEGPEGEETQHITCIRRLVRRCKGNVGVRRENGIEHHKELPENCIHLSVFVQES